MRCFLIIIFIVLLAAPVQAQSRNYRDCEAGDPDRKIKGCTRIIKRGRASQKDLATAYYNRGIAYYHKRSYDRAIADYGHTIRLNPKNSEAYNNRGIAYEKKGQLEQAAKDYEQSLKLRDKPSANDHNNVAWAWFKAGKPAYGLRDAETAVILAPKDHDIRDTLGAIHEALGSRDKAIRAYSKAMALDPKHETSREHLKRLGVLP